MSVLDVNRGILAARKGLSFLGRYALDGPCWESNAPDVQYLLYHQATRPKDLRLRRQARALAMRAAHRWLRERPHVPTGTPAPALLWWYAYGTFTPTRLGLNTKTLRRELSICARRFGARDFLGFDPRAEPPPSTLYAQCSCGTSNGLNACCPACGDRMGRIDRYQAWEQALVGAHIAEELGLNIGCTVADVARWRAAMLPYPRPQRGLTRLARHAVYAATHLVFVLNGYGLLRLPAEHFGAEAELMRLAGARAVASKDVELLGETIEVLTALGLNTNDPLLIAGRSTLLASQRHDGSWGSTTDLSYTRMHKTWVAIDALTTTGTRRLVRRAVLSPVVSVRQRSRRRAEVAKHR